MAITHVLFDFDGTLVNTIDCYVEIVEQIIVSRRKRITEEIKDFIPNINSFASLVDFVNEKIKLGMTHDEFTGIFKEKLLNSNLQLLPGVEKLIQHLYKNGILMAVATGNSKSWFEKVSAKFGNFFPKYFSHYVCGFDDPDVVKTKPSPDVYFVAVKRFNIQPESMENVLIFEDSITGLKGALASGGKTVFVARNCSQIKNEHEEILKKLSLKISSLEHFQPEVFGLPSYK